MHGCVSPLHLYNRATVMWFNGSPYTCTHITNMSSSSKVCFSLFSLLEPTLTFSNVTEAVKLVHGFRWNATGLPYWLNIPPSKSIEVQRLYSQRRPALLKHFLEDHPCPSWKLIAYAVFRGGEYGALEIIQRDYFKGE